MVSASKFNLADIHSDICGSRARCYTALASIMFAMLAALAVMSI